MTIMSIQKPIEFYSLMTQTPNYLQTKLDWMIEMQPMRTTEIYQTKGIKGILEILWQTEKLGMRIRKECKGTQLFAQEIINQEILTNQETEAIEKPMEETLKAEIEGWIMDLITEGESLVIYDTGEEYRNLRKKRISAGIML